VFVARVEGMWVEDVFCVCSGEVCVCVCMCVIVVCIHARYLRVSCLCVVCLCCLFVAVGCGFVRRVGV
jgi:hypothetical protein